VITSKQTKKKKKRERTSLLLELRHRESNLSFFYDTIVCLECSFGELLVGKSIEMRKKKNKQF